MSGFGLFSVDAIMSLSVVCLSVKIIGVWMLQRWWWEVGIELSWYGWEARTLSCYMFCCASYPMYVPSYVTSVNFKKKKLVV